MENKEKVMLDMPVSRIRAKGLLQFKQHWKALMPLVVLQIILANVGGYLFSLMPSSLVTIGILLAAPLEVGLCIAVLKTARGGRAEVSDLFFPYKAYFFKAIGLDCLIALFVVLWSLTGIIPGVIFLGILAGGGAKGSVAFIFFAVVVVVLMLIPAVIAVYRYSQALFVFIDNPELKVKECIEKSKELMLDNKKKLFFLDLSFIGWGLAAAAPVIIAVLLTIGRIKMAILEMEANQVFGELHSFGVRDIVEVILMYATAVIVAGIISLLLSIPVVAYNAVARATAYDILTGRADKNGEYKEPVDVSELTDIDKVKAKLEASASCNKDKKSTTDEKNEDQDVTKNDEDQAKDK